MNKPRITISEFKKLIFEIISEQLLIHVYERLTARCIKLFTSTDRNYYLCFIVVEEINKRRQYNILYKNFIITTDTDIVLNNWEGFCYQMFDKVLGITS